VKSGAEGALDEGAAVEGDGAGRIKDTRLGAYFFTSSAKVLDLRECQRHRPTFSGYRSASLSSSSETTQHTGGEAHVEYAGECS
jgi:hypothetical protein